jgi:hypothetical protein
MNKEEKLSPEIYKKAKTEFARSGGEATYKKYGREHYVRMIRKRWDRRKEDKN